MQKPTLPLRMGVCLLAIFAPAASAVDVARFMPADTLAYVGASGLLDDDSPQFALQEKLAKSLAQLLEQSPDSDLAPIAGLLAFLKPLQTGSFGVGLLDVRRRGEEWEIEAVAVVDAADQTPQLPARLRDLLQRGAPPAERRTQTIRGTEFAEGRLGEPAIPLLWGMIGGRLVVATSPAAVEQVMACIEDEAPNLADTTELKSVRNEVKGSADSRHGCAFVNLRRGLDRVRERCRDDAEVSALLEPAVQDQLGLSALRSLYWHMDTLDDRPRVVSFLHIEGPRRGLFRLYEQPLLEESKLAIVPRDAYWASAANADLAKVWTELRGVLDAVAPEKVPPIDGALAMTTQMLGFSITDDLLPALGETWILFDAPTHGGFLLSGTVLAIDVRQRQELQDMLSRLLQMAESAAAGADFTVRRKALRHREHEIHYLLLGGVPAPIAPAWTFTDDRIFIGLFPQTVAAALRQVDSTTRGPSLLDNPHYRALRAKLPREACEVFYADANYFARLLYPLVTMAETAGISMLAPYGGEIDLQLMPMLPDRVADVTALVGTAGPTPHGIRSDLLGDGADTLAVAMTALTVSAILGAFSEEPQDEERATEIAVSMANLRAIAAACGNYAAETDKLPDSLEVLIERDYLKPAMLISPLRGEGAYVYVRAGQNLVDIDNDSRAVLAYEWLEEEGIGLVAFVDGHVEAVKRGDFRKLMRETYKNVGREKDLPKQFRE